MSNSERIQRAAAEAAAKSEAKAKKPPARARAPRAPKAPARMKIVWGVMEPGHEPVSTYAYPDRASADADCAKRGKNYAVRPVKVPMEPSA
jgi:hypothetical protein